MKIIYENYHKCIYFTYDEIKNHRLQEFKFKVYIKNDVKDDLYRLYSEIIVQKMVMLGHPIDPRECDDVEVDRFVMVG